MLARVSEQPSEANTRLVPSMIVFLLIAAGAVAACVAGAGSSEAWRSFVDIGSAYRLLMGAEIFFLLFVWPLFSSRPGSLTSTGLAALAVVSVPLVLIAATVSGTPLHLVVLSHLLAAAVGAAVAGVGKLGGKSVWRWYYPVAALLAGGVPLGQFLLLDLTGRGLGWLSVCSPFWAMELTLAGGPQTDRLRWAVTILIFAGMAAASTALASFQSKRSANRFE